MWVGTGATPNRMGAKRVGRPETARTKVNHFKIDPTRNPSPIPLEECPWCREKFSPDSFDLLPDPARPGDLRVHCINFESEFGSELPLPVVAVDEPLYRRLPAFLVAAVDKFAALPWTGETGTLLGGADRYDKNGYFRACDSGLGRLLPHPLLPPDLIIQDELRLISGPLGTMAGPHETAIEVLYVLKSGNHSLRPKIVASTATVRREQDQIRGPRPTSCKQVLGIRLAGQEAAGSLLRSTFSRIRRPAGRAPRERRHRRRGDPLRYTGGLDGSCIGPQRRSRSPASGSDDRADRAGPPPSLDRSRALTRPACTVSPFPTGWPDGRDRSPTAVESRRFLPIRDLVCPNHPALLLREYPLKKVQLSGTCLAEALADIREICVAVARKQNWTASNGLTLTCSTGSDLKSGRHPPPPTLTGSPCLQRVSIRQFAPIYPGRSCVASD